jgi:hypothetical protein
MQQYKNQACDAHLFYLYNYQLFKSSLIFKYAKREKSNHIDPHKFHDFIIFYSS